MIELVGVLQSEQQDDLIPKYIHPLGCPSIHNVFFYSCRHSMGAIDNSDPKEMISGVKIAGKKQLMAHSWICDVVQRCCREEILGFKDSEAISTRRRGVAAEDSLLRNISRDTGPMQGMGKPCGS